MRRPHETFFIALFAVSIGFGLFKQAKTVWRSADEFGAARDEPGAAAVRLKERLERAVGRAAADGMTFAYRTDRPSPKGYDGHHRYDVQYGFAPYVLWPDRTEADCDLLDFQEADLELSCR